MGALFVSSAPIKRRIDADDVNGGPKQLFILIVKESVNREMYVKLIFRSVTSLNGNIISSQFVKHPNLIKLVYIQDI